MNFSPRAAEPDGAACAHTPQPQESPIETHASSAPASLATASAPTKAVVLSSGGVDSTTCLALAVAELGAENVSAVSFFYGQKHSRELEASERVAAHYGVAHHVLDLAAVFAGSACSLLAGSSQEIDHRSYGEQLAESSTGLVSTYVPFRNGLMLSAAAAHALSLNPDEKSALYLGIHTDDGGEGAAYPDCTPEFAAAMGEAISQGTAGMVCIRTPFVGVNKAGVVAEGLRLGVPYELTWSCYEGGEVPCGECGTCIDRAAAFAANGVCDPALAGNSPASGTQEAGR